MSREYLKQPELAAQSSASDPARRDGGRELVDVLFGLPVWSLHTVAAIVPALVENVRLMGLSFHEDIHAPLERINLAAFDPTLEVGNLGWLLDA